MVLISVIVCTHNRAAHLGFALDSLLAQTLDHASFDVVVVDNRSEDGTAELVHAAACRDGRVRYAFEPELGLSAARNTGLQATEAELVAFLDDDARAAPDWLERILHRFTTLEPKPGGLGGEIDPIWEAPRPDWLSDAMLQPLSARLGWSEEAIFLADDQWLCEANSAYQRRLLLRYGGFSTNLGRRGTNLLSGENALNELMRQDGWRLFFDPAIRVRHFIHADRVSREWFRRRYFWQGVTSAIVSRERRRAGGRNGELWRILDLPSSAAEWIEVLQDDALGTPFEDRCHRLAHLGYVLGLRGLVD